MSLLDNIAVGVDIEEIERFKDLDQRFLDKVYTSEEINYCRKKAKPEESFAARFCAKEAIIKALYSIDEHIPEMNEIEILTLENGVPAVNLKKNKHLKVKISLSHANNLAIVYVILEKVVK